MKAYIKFRLHIIAPLCFSLIFFLVAFFTLSDYGPSWDETIHFRRGQSYLHYFFTGDKNYQSLPKINLQGTKGDPDKVPVPRRSFYQNDTQNGEYFLNKDIGHPPLNGEMSALLNYIFYQKLGIMNDLSSHHLFNILVSALLVFTVSYFSYRYLGFFSSLITFLVLSTYPLFFSESHFNIKDPALASFFSATLLSFVISLEKKSIWWLIISAILFGLALGTKLNILFLPLIILPYLVFEYKDKWQYFSKAYYYCFFLAPLIIILLFIGPWPYLWQSFPNNLLNILNFYKDVGTGVHYQPESFYFFGFNSYPALWILYTTPPLVLGLTVVGIISAWLNRRLHKGITLLWFFWLIIPILRVTFPGTNIYGGVRQILEFLPAMAIISGLGAWQIVNWMKVANKYLLVIKVLLVIMFLWPLFVLIKLHPYENVYFNFLIGGLKGASERDFPSWGNSLGSAYKGGIEWLNINAEQGAKLTLIQGTSSNALPTLLRKDINYLVGGDIDAKSSHFSGIERGGEYIMELTFSDTGKDFHYVWQYVDNFLIPVYELKIDGVPILKIWKNDLQHTKSDLKLVEREYQGNMDMKVDKNEIIINVGDVILASRLVVLFKNEDCMLNQNGFIETSIDGNNWQRERDIFPQYQTYRTLNLVDSKLEYFFAARKLRHIKILSNNLESCILSSPEVKLSIL